MVREALPRVSSHQGEIDTRADNAVYTPSLYDSHASFKVSSPHLQPIPSHLILSPVFAATGHVPTVLIINIESHVAKH